MLVPAMLYKDEIEKEFSALLYTDDMFYYQGYAHGHELSEIKPQDNLYQWAIVGKGPIQGSIHDLVDGTDTFVFDNKLIGYFAYRIDLATNSVYNFGLISFDKQEDKLNARIGHDVFTKMRELIEVHHRIEWRCVGGNPAFRGYVRFLDRICDEFPNVTARYTTLHDVTKDNKGNYRDEYIMEIINYDN